MDKKIHHMAVGPDHTPPSPHPHAYLDDYELNEVEQRLADKLADAGPEQEEAEAWVRDIVTEAMKRGC